MAPVTVGEILACPERLGIGQSLPVGGQGRPVNRVALYAGTAAAETAALSPGRILIFPRDGAKRVLRLDGEGPLSRSRVGNLACVAFSEATFLPGPVRRCLRLSDTPAFTSRYPPELLQSRLVGLLREFGERIVMVHGVLVDLGGCGLLLIGESGIGKTAYGLEIVARGQRFVADDAVVLQRKGDLLFGRPHPRTKNRIALREGGILPAERLLGAGAVLDETRVTAVVRLFRQGGDGEASKEAGETPAYAVLGLALPCERLAASADPVRRAEQVTELLCRWRSLRPRFA
jgi:serine kinase of HPr protein (carbohydrate metabolism regulator)